jgi:hypothetical protein
MKFEVSESLELIETMRPQIGFRWHAGILASGIWHMLEMDAWMHGCMDAWMHGCMHATLTPLPPFLFPVPWVHGKQQSAQRVRSLVYVWAYDIELHEEHCPRPVSTALRQRLPI